MDQVGTTTTWAGVGQTETDYESLSIVGKSNRVELELWIGIRGRPLQLDLSRALGRIVSCCRTGGALHSRRVVCVSEEERATQR